MKKNRSVVALLVAALLAASSHALAEVEGQRLVAALYTGHLPAKLQGERFGELPRRLAELGYIENKNIRFEWRCAEGDYLRLPGLAAEVVRLHPDVILTEGTPGIRAVQGATHSIPIVFIGGADLVASGLVKSLAHPGGNTTGVSLLLSDTIGKQLELLKGILPGVSRIAVLVNPTNPVQAALLKDFRSAGQALRITIVSLEAHTPAEIDAAFASASRDKIEALIWTVDSFLIQQQRQSADLAAKYRLPSLSGTLEYPEVGGLMGYGPNRWKLWQRAAEYIDKILNGANPGDLPVEQPTKLELVINGKTAKALGLTIPPELLVQADRVIE